MQRMKLQADISVAYLVDVEQQLGAILLRALHREENKRRNGFFERKIVPLLYFVVKFFSAVLVMLAILLQATGVSLCNSLAFDIFIGLFGGFFLFLFWDRNRLELQLAVVRERLFSWLSKKRSRMMLRQALQLAPFTAAYELHANVLAYYRIKNDTATLVWHRTLQGFYLAGDGFILFYKTENQSHPFAIVLHACTHELSDYLKSQSLTQLAN